MVLDKLFYPQGEQILLSQQSYIIIISFVLTTMLTINNSILKLEIIALMTIF